jgi:hypothetical protein
MAASVVAGAVLAVGTPVSAQDAYTTRIEPRAVYGASVTIEEGVRVFRPLPSERHVIVNPDGMTPLSLGYVDTRVTAESRNYNYNYGSPSYAPQTYGGAGYPFLWPGQLSSPGKGQPRGLGITGGAP